MSAKTPKKVLVAQLAQAISLIALIVWDLGVRHTVAPRYAPAITLPIGFAVIGSSTWMLVAFLRHKRVR